MEKNFQDELNAARTELGINEEKNTTPRIETEFVKVLKVKGDDVIFDFGELTGNLIIEAKKRFKKKTDGEKTVITVEELDDRYLMLIAEIVSKVKYEVLTSLKYREYAAIKDATRNFLLNISDTTEEQ